MKAGADFSLRKPSKLKELKDIIESIPIKEDMKHEIRPVFVSHQFSKSK